MTEWEEWTTCSKTCDTGVRSRIKSSSPLVQSENCEDLIDEEVQACNTEPCGAGERWDSYSCAIDVPNVVLLLLFTRIGCNSIQKRTVMMIKFLVAYLAYPLTTVNNSY